MRAILAIARKELAELFASPIAYASLTAVALVTSLSFFDSLKNFNTQLMIVQSQVILSEGMMGAIPAELNLFDMVFLPTVVQTALVLLVVVPLVTMGVFAQERTRRTDELLLTLPVRNTQVVAGKFLATYIFLFTVLVVTVLFPALTVAYTDVGQGPMLTVFVGMVLLACALASLGLLGSSLTQTQLVAALSAYAVSLTLFDFNWMTEFTGERMDAVLRFLSLQAHFESFPRGLLPLEDVLYLLALCVMGFLLARAGLGVQRIH